MNIGQLRKAIEGLNDSLDVFCDFTFDNEGHRSVVFGEPIDVIVAESEDDGREYLYLCCEVEDKRDALLSDPLDCSGVDMMPVEEP